MRHYIGWLIRHRATASIVIAVSLALAMFSARRLKVQFQFRDFYDYPANSQLPLFKQDAAEFGDPAGNVVILIEAQDVFAPTVLGYVDRLTRALDPDPTFIHVRSLTSARGVYAKNDDIATGPLYRELPPSADDARAVREYVIRSPLYVHRLLSPDGHFTAILAEMRTPATFATIDEQSAAVDAVRAVLAKNPRPDGVRTTITGSPVVETETTHSLLRDQMTLIPGVMTVIILALIWTFRSSHGVALCLASVNVAMIWAAGIYALFDRHVDILVAVTPTALLVYGVVDPIFVLTRFLQKLELGLSKEEAIERTFVELALPCFLTSLTTAVGFGTFALAIAPTVRFYGLTVAIGVLLAWVTTVTVLPLLLAIVPLPTRRHSALASTKGVSVLLQAVWVRIRARPRTVLGVAVALVAASAVFGSSQHLSNGYVSSLPNGQVKEDVKVLEDKISGVIRLIVYLHGPPDSMKRPEVLQAMMRVDAAMIGEPGVTSAMSIAEQVADVAQAFEGGAADGRRIPDSKSLVAQYLALIDPEDKADLVSADDSTAHIAFLVKDRGSEAARALSGRLASFVRASGLEEAGIRTSLTGNGVVSFGELDSVVMDILRGFVTAFLLILVLEAIAFRSLRLAALTILPNLVPVTACFVAIRLFHVMLRLDTALVLCVSIGGLFNTTIHIVARLRQIADTSASGDRDAVVQATLLTVGPPSLYTAVILSAGFAVLGLSRFPGFQAMGFLSMLTLMTGFVSDTVLTSSSLKLFYPWWEAESARTITVPLEEVSS